MVAGVKLPRTSLPDQIVETLREMIIQGTLPEGAKVPVAALAQELSVSQTPLREALKVLAADSLVELLPNRGAIVAHYTSEDARHLFQVLAGLESLGAELATQCMTVDDLATLEEMHARMRICFVQREKEAYFNLNSAIHERIILLSGNPMLRDLHARLMFRASRGRYLAIEDTQRWVQAMDEHEMLMESLRDRNAAAAASIWRQHLQHTGAATIRALEAHRELESTRKSAS